MRDGEASPVTHRSLLERIEAAPPTDVIAVVEDELTGLVGAHGVSFLIADYLGRADRRISSAPRASPLTVTGTTSTAPVSASTTSGRWDCMTRW